MALKAGRKDSVASIAKRYRVSAAQVAQWNGVGKGASFQPGQTVVVFVAGKAVRTAAHKAPAGKHGVRSASASRKSAPKQAHGGAAAKRLRVAHN
jgi:membrane-bound lytic murein transglycosylase D